MEKMLVFVKPRWRNLFWGVVSARKQLHGRFRLCTSMPSILRSQELQEICSIVSGGIGSLDDLEVSLNKFTISLTSPAVAQVLDFCKSDAPTRRLLRFFSWSRKILGGELGDEEFNHAIRVLAEKKDFMALDILISDLGKEGRAMESWTFSVVAEVLVKLGREDEALGIFKILEKFKCPQDSAAVTAIVSALCAKGHARRAEGVVYHHKDKISGMESCIYRSLLHGWSVQKNVKEARKIIKTMKSVGIMPDLFCFNTFLRCLCERNLKSNPSGLVPEALNVMMEMRTYGIVPNSVSYNILLSCLGRTRRVKESLRILDQMRKSGCSPDWVSYYIVARVLYLTGRFGKGKQIVEKMVEEGLVPERKFYYDLIGVLCGVERVKYALELFEQMKKSMTDSYGPVYDLLIPKLCRGGDFEKATELWDEATAGGVILQCSSDVLDPSITEVFKPKRPEKVNVALCTKPINQMQKMKSMEMKNKSTQTKKRKRKSGSV